MPPGGAGDPGYCPAQGSVMLRNKGKSGRPWPCIQEGLEWE